MSTETKSDKKTLGYTTNGYVLETEIDENSPIVNGGSGATGEGSGSFSDGGSGLRTVGNIITDTWEYICKLDKFGPIIINGKDNKLNLVPDKGHSNIICELSDTTKVPIPTTTSALTAYGTNNYTCIFGCSVPSFIIKEYCNNLFSGTPFEDGEAFNNLIKAGLLGVRIKIQVASTTAANINAMVISVDQQGAGGNQQPTIFVNGGLFTSSSNKDKGITIGLMVGKQICLGDENTSPRINGTYNVSEGTISDIKFSELIENGQTIVTTSDGYSDYFLNNTKYNSENGIECRIRFYLLSNDSSVVQNACKVEVPTATDSEGKGLFDAAESYDYKNLSTFNVSISLPEGINSRVIRYASEVIQLFESGTLKSNSYGLAEDLYPYDSAKMTYGKHQTTEASGNLRKLLVNYYFPNAHSQTAEEIKKYMPYLNKGNGWGKHGPYYKTMVDLLSKAGQEIEMQRAQDKFFEEVYLASALTKFKKYNLSYPLSLLVVWDSMVHGSLGKIWERSFGSSAYATTKEKEQSDIKKYCETRRIWLNGTGRLKTTAYRQSVFLNMMNGGNWNLQQDWYIPEKGWTVFAQQEGGKKGR